MLRETKVAFSLLAFYKKCIVALAFLFKKVFSKSPKIFDKSVNEFVQLIWFIKKGISIKKNNDNSYLFTSILNKKNIKLVVRKNSSDDLVFRDILLNEEYSFVLKTILLKENAVIIDA
ncbi:MAG: hypothetical protein ABL929_09755, partial [Ferruginibacter sp.]